MQSELPKLFPSISRSLFWPRFHSLHSFPIDFPTRNLYGFLILLIKRIFPTHLKLLDSTTLTNPGEDKKVWCDFFCPRQFLLAAISLDFFSKICNFLTLSNQVNKCTCIKQVLSHIINYQYVWIAFEIIRGDLQEHKIHCQIVKAEPLKSYNECLRFAILSQILTYVLLKSYSILLLKQRKLFVLLYVDKV